MSTARIDSPIKVTGCSAPLELDRFRVILDVRRHLQLLMLEILLELVRGEVPLMTSGSVCARTPHRETGPVVGGHHGGTHSPTARPLPP